MPKNNVVTKITAALTMVGILGAGIWAVDGRYAKAGEVQQLRKETKEQVMDLKADTLENRRQAIKRTVFDLERLKGQRPLSAEEQQYLQEMKDDVDSLTDQLRALRKR